MLSCMWVLYVSLDKQGRVFNVYARLPESVMPHFFTCFAFYKTLYTIISIMWAYVV